MKKLTPLVDLVLKSLLLLGVSVQAVVGQTKTGNPELKKLLAIHNLDSGRVYAQQLLSAARAKNDKVLEGKIYYTWSFQAYSIGNEIKALEIAREGKSHITTADPETFVEMHTMIAYMLSRRGNDVEALNEAFSILRRTDKEGWKKLSIDCRICIADLYRTIRQAQKAIPYALQAERDAKALKDTAQYIFAISTLSNVYSDHDLATPANMAKAIRYMEIILNKPFALKLGDYETARYLSNLGRLYQMEKRYNDAERVLERAMAIDDKNGFKGLKKNALNEYLTAKIGQGKYAEAAKYGEQALAMLPPAQSSRLQQMAIYYRLEDAYAGLKDYKKAYDNFKKADAIDDSLLAADKASSAVELDEKYKADKRLLQASSKNLLLQQQRNFSIVIGLLIILAVAGIYRWFIYKKKKQADLLAEEHKQLARLDALKTKFFANISHELRTPLTLIMGPAEQLINNDNMDVAQQSNHHDTILRNSKKLLSMVNELLDLGKIEAGNMPVRLEQVGLYQFVSVLYQGFASAAEHKSVRYEFESNIDKALSVKIDTEKFEKIANNLISNAIKFTPSSGRIVVKAVVSDGKLNFSVADTGNGIRETDLPHVFDRYYQANHDNAPAQGGTGIGLAIAREFTELLGGVIKVESGWGAGSLFMVEVPLSDVTAVPESVPQRLQPATKPVTSSTDKKLVLLVEDHAEMSAHIASILSPLYTIVSAADGNEALAILNNVAVLPDLVISDVMMPGMDGFTLLNRLKHSTTFFKIPVIMLTALSDTPNKLHALHIGVDDYLTKPFNGNELLSRAANLIQNASQRTKVSHEDLTELSAAEAAKEETETANMAIAPADMAWLAEVEVLVRKYTGRTDLNIAMLSYDLAISERQLFRRIKSITGLTPNKYIRTIRLQVAREAIESGNYRTVAEVSYIAGFETPAYFSKIFKEHFGRDVNEVLRS